MWFWVRRFLICILAPALSLMIVPAAFGQQTDGTVTNQQNAEDKTRPSNTQELYRPGLNEFPPLARAHSYRGELVFVDHANRRGSLRIDGNGRFRFAGPSPFALLPYAVVRYHGAPADLRDIPLGTVLRVWAFLPPDPRISAVPVLPVNNRTRKLGYAGTGTAPAENHVLLLEDEPSYCQRMGLVWRIKEVDVAGNQGMVVALQISEKLASKKAGSANEVRMTFDGATQIWRGRECLAVQDLIDEGMWPVSGKKSLDGQDVLVGITWKPTPSGVFTQFHLSDIWLDGVGMQRASRKQTERHKVFMRSRWLPARVDRVEYGVFGNAEVSVTLFGGMDETLYADFRTGRRVLMAPSENTLKHWAGGTAGTVQMASRGPIIDVSKQDKPVPVGSSGIQIQMETDLVTEGVRPGRIVRTRPEGWPNLEVPREEYLHHSRDTLDHRFPLPDIFPLYR